MNSSSFSSKEIAILKSIRTDFAVRVILAEGLQPYAANMFTTYVNVQDILTDNVVSSETLFDEALKYVKNDELPNYSQGDHQVFSRRFSFDQKDRVKGLDLFKFEKIVMCIVLELRSVPTIELSDRAVKPVTLEDVRAALQLRLPSTNFDEVFVTGFVNEDGEPKVLQSRTVAEDIHAHFLDNEIPYYYGDQIGIYTVAYSAQKDHVHPELTARDISNLVIDIVPAFLD